MQIVSDGKNTRKNEFILKPLTVEDIENFYLNGCKNELKIEREVIKVPDYRVWKQRQNLSSEDIINNIMKQQNKIKNYTEALNEEEKNDKRKKIKSYQRQ